MIKNKDIYCEIQLIIAIMEAIDVKKCICLNAICNDNDYDNDFKCIILNAICNDNNYDNDLINNENINNNNNDNDNSIINTNQAICKLKCGCEIHSSCYVDYVKCRLEDKVCIIYYAN